VAVTLPFVLLPIGRAQRSNLAQEQAPASKISSPSPSDYRSPGDRHKVQVTDPDKAKALEAQGARLIADYSSYRVYETDTALMNSVGSDATTQIRDDDNVIQLNAGAMDTTKPEAQAERGAVEAFSGKRMHLIQFAGPIKPE